MPRLVPLGSRVLCKDIQPETVLESRAKRAGIYVVIDEKNIPQPTSAIVHAVGPDRLTQELIKEGDTVLFSRHAGQLVMIEGVEYRSLELRECSHVIKPDSMELELPTQAAPPEE